MIGATQFFPVCSDEDKLTYLVLRAFADLGVDILQDLKSDRMKLTSLVLQHIVPGTIYTPGMEDKDVVKTLMGDKITIDKHQDGGGKYSSTRY